MSELKGKCIKGGKELYQCIYYLNTAELNEPCELSLSCKIRTTIQ